MHAERNHFVFLQWRTGGPSVSPLAKLYVSLFSLLTCPPFRSFLPAVLDASDRNQRSNCQIPWITEKAREFQKNVYCFIDYIKTFDCVDHCKLWKIVKEMGTPDCLTCLLRNLYAVQESTELDMEQWAGYKIGKGVCQGSILSPCLFNLYAEYFM